MCIYWIIGTVLGVVGWLLLVEVVRNNILLDQQNEDLRTTLHLERNYPSGRFDPWTGREK